MKIEKTLNLTKNPNTDYFSERVLKLIPGHEIDAISIIHAFAELKKTNTNRSLTRMKTAVYTRICFHLKYTNQSKEIPYWTDIFKEIKFPYSRKSPVQPENIPTEEEFDFLIQELKKRKEIQLAIFVLALRGSGVRPGELINIKLCDCTKLQVVENIDGENVTTEFYKIRINATKTNSYYYSVWSVDLFNLVNDYFHGNEYLLESKYTNKKFTKGTIGRYMRLCSQILNRKFYPYLLRHTFATNHYARTGDGLTGSILMGHSPETHMRTYIHIPLNVTRTLKATKQNEIKYLKGVLE